MFGGVVDLHLDLRPALDTPPQWLGFRMEVVDLCYWLLLHHLLKTVEDWSARDVLKKLLEHVMVR